MVMVKSDLACNELPVSYLACSGARHCYKKRKEMQFQTSLIVEGGTLFSAGYLKNGKAISVRNVQYSYPFAFGK